VRRLALQLPDGSVRGILEYRMPTTRNHEKVKASLLLIAIIDDKRHGATIEQIELTPFQSDLRSSDIEVGIIAGDHCEFVLDSTQKRIMKIRLVTKTVRAK
jgi:hypothetical protein